MFCTVILALTTCCANSGTLVKDGVEVQVVVLILTDSPFIITRDTNGTMEKTKTKPKTENPRMSQEMAGINLYVSYQ